MICSMLDKVSEVLWCKRRQHTNAALHKWAGQHHEGGCTWQSQWSIASCLWATLVVEVCKLSVIDWLWFSSQTSWTQFKPKPNRGFGVHVRLFQGTGPPLEVWVRHMPEPEPEVWTLFRPPNYRQAVTLRDLCADAASANFIFLSSATSDAVQVCEADWSWLKNESMSVLTGADLCSYWSCLKYTRFADVATQHNFFLCHLSFVHHCSSVPICPPYSSPTTLWPWLPPPFLVLVQSSSSIAVPCHTVSMPHPLTHPQY